MPFDPDDTNMGKFRVDMTWSNLKKGGREGRRKGGQVRKSRGCVLAAFAVRGGRQKPEDGKHPLAQSTTLSPSQTVTEHGTHHFPSVGLACHMSAGFSHGAKAGD